MLFSSSINYQVISFTKGTERADIKKMRESSKREFDLIVKRDDSIIRYSSNLVQDCHYEIQFQFVKRQAEIEVDNRNFSVIYLDESNCLKICLYKGNVLNRQEEYSDEMFEYIKQFPIFYEEGVMIDLTDCESLLIDRSILVDDKGNPLEFSLTNLAHLLKKKQRQIGGFLSIFLLLFCGFYLKDLFFNQIKNFEKIEREVFVEVDSYKEYRDAVSRVYTLDQLIEPIQSAYITLMKLPFGWKFESIDFQNGVVTTEILHSGGSLSLLNEYLKQDHNGKFVNRDGIQSVLEFEVKSVGSLWKEQGSNFIETRDGFLDFMIKFNGVISSNKSNSNGNFKVQNVGVELKEIDLTALTLIQKEVSNKPIFINHLSVIPTEKVGVVNVVINANIIGFL